MPANPFYIQPADFSKGLTGLADTIAQVGERKRADKEKESLLTQETAAKQEISDAIATKDATKIQSVMGKYPGQAKNIKAIVETKFPNEQLDFMKTSYMSAALDIKKAPEILEEIKTKLGADGFTPEETEGIRKFEELIVGDPDAAKKGFEAGLALLTTGEQKGGYWDRYQDIKGVVDKESSTADIKEYKFAKEQGFDGSFMDYKNKFGSVGSSKTYSPSPLKKLMDERQALVDSGLEETDPKIKAYDNKISGVDIDLDTMTPEEIDTFGAYFNATGKMPSLGRGKQSTKIRMGIAKSAARQALGADADGVPEGDPGQTPSEAAFSMISEQSDTKAIQGSLNFLDKQLSSMGSFVVNLNSQVDKVGELAKDLKTFDSSLMNKPLRFVRGKLKGSALQSKYDMYLSEIESEIGKLATGSTGSVAELSASAQEKWSSIHDKNLSVEKMLSLLEETKNAANFRFESVKGQLEQTRARMKTRDPVSTGQTGPTTQRNEPTQQTEIENMAPGEIFIGPDGKKYRKR